MDWKKLHEILDQKFQAERCLERISTIHSTDRWNSFDRYIETADYCAMSMEAAGLKQVEKLPLNADGKTCYDDWGISRAWRAEYGVLRYADGEVISDYSQVPCSLSMYCPSTNGEVEGEVVDITGMDELPTDGSLKGKVLLTDKKVAGVQAQANQVGAIGVLSYGVRLLPGIRDSKEDIYDACLWEGMGRKNPNNVFGFKLTPRQGDRMLEQLKNGPVRVRAEVKAESYDGISYTVSGALMGTDPTLPEVFAYAHLYETGADDNASGSGALLELGACLEEAIQEGLLPRPKRNIRFAMGNECGGSMGYMCAHRDRKMLCGGVADMIGAGEELDNAFMHLRYDPVANWSFADAAMDASARLLDEYNGNTSKYYHDHFHIGLGTDNIIADPCFEVPTIAMVACPTKSYHSSMDMPERIDLKVLKRNAMVLGAYLYGLAAADEETCAFLQEEIEALAAKELAATQEPRKRNQILEAKARALHSLRKIEPQLPFAEPKEEGLPMPAYAAEHGDKVPVRLVEGTLTLKLHPPVDAPRWRPAWNAEWNIPLFWADGNRSLWQIAVQTALEMEEYSDEAIQKRYEELDGYFHFLGELGYLTWK